MVGKASARDVENEMIPQRKVFLTKGRNVILIQLKTLKMPISTLHTKIYVLLQRATVAEHWINVNEVISDNRKSYAITYDFEITIVIH